jgi:hypothetical protein
MQSTTQKSIGSQDASKLFSTEYSTQILSTGTTANHQEAGLSYQNDIPIPALILPDYFLDDWRSEFTSTEPDKNAFVSNGQNSTGMRSVNLQSIPEQEILFSSNKTLLTYPEHGNYNDSGRKGIINNCLHDVYMKIKCNLFLKVFNVFHVYLFQIY